MKFGKLPLIILIVIFCGGLTTTLAQDSVDCDADGYREIMKGISDAVLELSESITTDEDGIVALLQLELTLDLLRFTCMGEDYTSETNPNGIIGPVMFGGTLYQAEFNALDEYGFLQLRVIEGDCGFTPPLMTTDIDGGLVADLWEFGGDCIAMIEVNGFGEWTLNIGRLQ